MRDPNPSGHTDLLGLLRNGDIKPVSFAFRKYAPPGRRQRWRWARAHGVPPWEIFGGRGDLLDRVWWRWQEIDSLWTLMLWGPIAWMVLYALAPVLALWCVARYLRRAAPLAAR